MGYHSNDRLLSVDFELIRKESVLGESDLIRGVFKRKLSGRCILTGLEESKHPSVNIYRGHVAEIWAFSRNQKQFIVNYSKETRILVVHLQGNEFCYQ